MSIETLLGIATFAALAIAQPIFVTLVFLGVAYLSWVSIFKPEESAEFVEYLGGFISSLVLGALSALVLWTAMQLTGSMRLADNVLLSFLANIGIAGVAGWLCIGSLLDKEPHKGE